MKTIAEIASEIGVSRQAVYKKIKQEPLSSSLRAFSVNRDNVTYIEPGGEKLIKSAFGHTTHSSKAKHSNVSIPQGDSLSTQFIASLQGQINTLTEQNRDLREQLNLERQHSRVQSDKITELATDMARLTNNAQQLHGGDIMQRLTDRSVDADQEDAAPGAADAPPQRKSRFLKKFFSSKE